MKTNYTILSWLDVLYSRKNRVRIWYGDKVTGKSWNEEHDVMGRVSKSTGTKPIYILVNNARSLGGPAILVDSIIRIDIIGVGTVYKHENFYTDLRLGEKLTSEVFNSLNQNVASFQTKEKAQKYIDFMEGKRYTK